MDIVVDLDGTICTEERTFERSLAKPIEGAVKAINALHAVGHTIIIYSARSWSEAKITEKWLEEYGVKYDRLILGKPVGDVWIDDRAIKFTSWKRTLEELGKPR
jgi:uncharacterized HAD superfamily protein